MINLNSLSRLNLGLFFCEGWQKNLNKTMKGHKDMSLKITQINLLLTPFSYKQFLVGYVHLSIANKEAVVADANLVNNNADIFYLLKS